MCEFTVNIFVFCKNATTIQTDIHEGLHSTIEFSFIRTAKGLVFSHTIFPVWVKGNVTSIVVL